MVVVESHQSVKECRQIHRSPIRLALLRTISAGASSDIQVLYWRVGISAGGLCEGCTSTAQVDPSANVLQAEKNLQDAWDSCYAPSQKNKS